MKVEISCVDCGLTVELPPTAGRPGFVDIAPIDGWTVPPTRCPPCSVAAGLDVTASAAPTP